MHSCLICEALVCAWSLCPAVGAVCCAHREELTRHCCPYTNTPPWLTLETTCFNSFNWSLSLFIFISPNSMLMLLFLDCSPPPFSPLTPPPYLFLLLPLTPSPCSLPFSYLFPLESMIIFGRTVFIICIMVYKKYPHFFVHSLYYLVFLFISLLHYFNPKFFAGSADLLAIFKYSKYFISFIFANKSLWGPSDWLPNLIHRRFHTDTDNICIAQSVVK